MRVVQILDCLSFGDAVSNHARELDKIGKKLDYSIETYCNYVDPRLDKQVYKNIKTYNIHKEDVIFYHLSTGCKLNREIFNFNVPVIVNFHNITPPEFFLGYNNKLENVSREGYDDLKYIKDNANNLIGIISDSNFDQDVLKKMGFRCDLCSNPILMDFNDYLSTPANKEIIALKENNVNNILFVGRIAPNKKQEDIIKSFYYYQKYFNHSSRLYLVGNYQHFEKYYLKLKKYCKLLGLDNVIFTGQISFSKIVAYYKIADLFLCESEHEGFCVPLVESMLFNIPIIAYDSTAIGETLRDGGILLEKKDPVITAGLINEVLTNNELNKSIKEDQKKYIASYSKSNIAKSYLNTITEMFLNFNKQRAIK